MTSKHAKLFKLLLAGIVVLTVTGCPPNKPVDAQQEGTFVVSRNKLFDQTSDFDLRWTAVYLKKEEGFNPSINVSDQELTFNRCTNCHECGFKPAFDYDNYGTPDWKPIYTGQQWAPIVERMNAKEDSMTNEQVANRIFTFLRDASLGEYDESADPKGAIVVEVDAPPPGSEEESTEGTEQQEGTDGNSLDQPAG